MNHVSSTATLNPFAENIVKDPRRVEAPVTGLNDRQLQRLLDEFGSLETDQLPRDGKQLSHALLVTSPEPGYGKSHLLGRFLRTLDRRATKIYIKPFQNPLLCWHSVLLRTVQELNFPDRSDIEFGQPGEPTQLDAFALGVLAHLSADRIEGGEIEHPDPKAAAMYLRANPVEAFGFADPADPWANWMRAAFGSLLPLFERQLQSHQIELAPSCSSWLRVLFGYAFFPTDFELRKTCLSWLKGESIEGEEGDKLGLRAREIVKPELQSDEINELCKGRIFDLCSLAGAYRPFVFCFDQTEIYGHRPELGRCFGMVISELVRQTCNHMTVVTANLDPWLKAILPYMEKADQDCFCSPHVSLEGLNRVHGEELIKSRLRRSGATTEGSGFFENGWFKEKFPSEQSRLGTRHFLQLCQKRWEYLANGASVHEKRSSETSQRSLEDFFDHYRQELLLKPKRLLFDPDTLLWLVQEAAKCVPGLTIEPHRGENLILVWKSGVRQTLFGFESGSHWKRWQVICREAGSCFQATKARTVFFRTPELGPIPGRWKIADEIESARRSYLEILCLTKAEVAELYAARELYAEAVQGNIPFGGDEALRLLAVKLNQWWERLKG